MSIKNNNRRKRKSILIGGLLGFLIGILGNLVASWIQQDLLTNSFTPLRIVIILCLSLVGIFIAQKYENFGANDDSGNNDKTDVTIKTGKSKGSNITGVSTGEENLGDTKISIETSDIEDTSITGAEHGKNSRKKQVQHEKD